jgi:hypothetical protein
MGKTEFENRNSKFEIRRSKPGIGPPRDHDEPRIKHCYDLIKNSGLLDAEEPFKSEISNLKWGPSAGFPFPWILPNESRRPEKQVCAHHLTAGG